MPSHIHVECVPKVARVFDGRADVKPKQRMLRLRNQIPAEIDSQVMICKHPKKAQLGIQVLDCILQRNFAWSLVGRFSQACHRSLEQKHQIAQAQYDFSHIQTWLRQQSGQYLGCTDLV